MTTKKNSFGKMNHEDKHHLRVILISILILIIFVMLVYYEYINLNLLFENNNIHINILTVASMIAGFLFSGLSILMTVDKSETVLILKKAKRMNEIYNSCKIGIKASLFSVILSIIGFLTMQNYQLILFLEIYALIIGILYFISTISQLFIIVSDYSTRD